MIYDSTNPCLHAPSSHHQQECTYIHNTLSSLQGDKEGDGDKFGIEIVKEIVESFCFTKEGIIFVLFSLFGSNPVNFGSSIALLTNYNN